MSFFLSPILHHFFGEIVLSEYAKRIPVQTIDLVVHPLRTPVYPHERLVTTHFFQIFMHQTPNKTGDQIMKYLLNQGPTTSPTKMQAYALYNR